ncbi:MAG: hypothetical protein WCG66_05810 [bacterium]
MQYFTLIGGFIGFSLAFAVSLAAGKNLEEAVFSATVGCLLTALLFRLFRLSLEYCAKQIIAEKSRLRDLENANQANAQAPQESQNIPPAHPTA